MRHLYCHFIFTVMISTMIAFLVGCAIGVKPRDYDAPPEDDVYYEESVYGSYYDAGSRSNVYHHYDPNYDPWTMSTYYQNYSGPARTGGSSSSSDTSGIRSENRRPDVKSRDSTYQSKAPGSEGNSLRKNRSTVSEYRETSSKDSPISRQKVRKDIRRETTRTSQKTRSEDDSQEKRRGTSTRTTSQKSRLNETEPQKEEEKEQETTQD